MISEEKFFELSREFLVERLGSKAEGIDANTELIESGILDSLMILEFFFFLEGITGTAVEPGSASVESLATLRSAYQLVVAA